MAARTEPEVIRLKHTSGVIVSVSAEKAERLIAEGGYTKAAARKSTAKAS